MKSGVAALVLLAAAAVVSAQAQCQVTASGLVFDLSKANNGKYVEPGRRTAQHAGEARGEARRGEARARRADHSRKARRSRARSNARSITAM